MATKKTTTGKQEVEEWLQTSRHPLKIVIEDVRKVILDTDLKMQERIKWNAPSFYCEVDFAAFNPRQEKFVQLILLFPYGLIKSDILLGDWKDRREARFENRNDVKEKSAALSKLVKQWIKLTGDHHAAQ